MNNYHNYIADQSYKNFEVIFIDYGSSENTKEQTAKLLRHYSFVQYYYNNTQGWLWNRAHAINTGFKKAKGDIFLIYDIDLIIEKEFLSSLSTFNFQNFFYTFSCFYLPQNFDFKKGRLQEQGIHYEQNYVGLCAVKSEFVFAVHGFDEYYMVWGGEDDDFYLRLINTGLQQKQVEATMLYVFHQWHPFESPSKPTLWYLSMVNYLYSKNRIGPKTGSIGTMFSKKNRPVLHLLKNDSFKNCTPLFFSCDSNFLFYNSFIKTFNELNDGEAAYIEYQPLEEKGSGPLSLFKKKNKLRSQPETKDVGDFLEYFIGINRPHLTDYYIRRDGSSLLFVCIKNEVASQEV